MDKQLTEFESQHIEVIEGLAAKVPGSYGIPKRIFEAYRGSHLGLGSSMTFADFASMVQQSPRLHALITAERELILDLAEGIVVDVLEGTAVKSDQFKMAQWVLKEQGRTRGYADGKKAVKVSSEHPKAPSVQINFVGPADVDKIRPPGRPKKQPVLIVQGPAAVAFPAVPPSRET